MMEELRPHPDCGAPLSACHAAPLVASAAAVCSYAGSILEQETGDLPWPREQKPAPRKPTPRFPGKGIRRPQRTAV
jgi:hypothetical protein